MAQILQAHEKYKQHNLITFPLKLSHQLKHEPSCDCIELKKSLDFPSYFSQLTLNSSHNFDNKNALGLLCGFVNDFIVINVDKPGEFKRLLRDNIQQTPQTVKQKTANGGFHLFFKYDSRFDDIIIGKDHCFGTDYAIDVRANGSFILVDPTFYKDKVDNVNWQYKWIHSIFDNEMADLPAWMYNLL